jgi:hypothetical protein
MLRLRSKLIVVAALLVSAGMTCGCGDGTPVTPTVGNPRPPSPAAAPIVQRVVPNKIPAGVQTPVTVYGERFHTESAVTFGGTPATVARAAANELTLLAPVHTAGVVDIVVTNPDGQSGRLVGAVVYEDAPAGAPVVTSISPTVGVTTGGAGVEIRGSGLHFATLVTLDGIVMRTFATQNGSLTFTTPPHAAGPVDLVLTNPGGEVRLPRAFTYAPPETFNFNGTWKGWADGPPDSLIEMSFTIANNALVSVSCGSATVIVSPPAPVSGGEFSFVGAAGPTLKGRMLSPLTAVGEIHALPCSPTWYATKQ